MKREKKKKKMKKDLNNNTVKVHNSIFKRKWKHIMGKNLLKMNLYLNDAKRWLKRQKSTIQTNINWNK